MNRPHIYETLMETAYAMAKRSTCSRLHVGSVLTMDTRIIASGWNGAPSGHGHCEHYVGEDLPSGCQRALHAELNSIAYAARKGVSTEGSVMVITHLPCLSCSQLILAAGVKSVIYDKIYRSDAGKLFLRDSGIPVDPLLKVVQNGI